MEGKNPKDLINQAEEQKYSVADDSLEVFSWFSDNSGEMFLASEVVEAITQDFGWDTQRVRRAITGLVDDSLDPVQQVVVNGNTHIGIIEYKEFQDFGGYGFIEYDDTLGQRKNLVCAKCVSEKEYASEPFRAVEGYGRHPEGCSYNHLLEHLEQHYDDSHSEKPSDIEVGASLVSGTTISSNTAIHGGNQSNFSVTDFAVGVLGDGELLSNSGGTLTGSSVSTDIDLLETQSVPDINNISKPTIAYVNSIDDYIAAFGNVIPDGAADSFDSYSVGKTGSFDKYSQTESGATPYITDTKAIDGLQSLTFDTAISSNAPDFFDWSFSSSEQPTDGKIYLRDNSSGGAGFSLVGPNGPIFNLMIDASQVRVVHADETEINQNVQDEWVKFSLSNIDWSAETFDITVTNATTSTQLGSFTGLSFTSSASSFDTWRFGCHQVDYSGGSVGGNRADRDTFWFDDIDFRE